MSEIKTGVTNREGLGRHLFNEAWANADRRSSLDELWGANQHLHEYWFTKADMCIAVIKAREITP
jgi:hypothetical protein